MVAVSGDVLIDHIYVLCNNTFLLTYYNNIGEKMKRNRYILGLISILLIISSLIFYIYYTQGSFVKNREVNKHFSRNEGVYINRTKYLDTLYKPVNYSERVKEDMPTIIGENYTNTLYREYNRLSNEQLLHVINNLENETKDLIRSLIGDCKNTLWEDYVKLVIYYELGIQDLLNSAKDNIIGRTITVPGVNNKAVEIRDRETGIQFIALASTLLEKAKTSLNNTSLKNFFCRYVSRDVREKVLELYNMTREYLSRNALKILDKVSNEDYSGVNIILLRSLILDLRNRINSSWSIYGNESRFYSVLEENVLNGLRAIVKAYINLYGAVMALDNKSLLENITWLMLDIDFINKSVNETIEILNRFYEKARNDPLRLVAYYIIVIEYYDYVNTYYSIVKEAGYNYFNQSVIEEIIENIPGTDKAFLYIILFPEIAENLIKTIETI